MNTHGTTVLFLVIASLMLECGNRQTDNSGERDISPFPIVETGTIVIEAPE